MSQRAFRTFRILTYLAQAVFWVYVIIPKVFVEAEIALAFTFTFTTLLLLHALQVLHLVMKDAEKLPDITEVYAKIKDAERAEEEKVESDTVNSILNHRKLYKAMNHLDDLECC